MFSAPAPVTEQLGLFAAPGRDTAPAAPPASRFTSPGNRPTGPSQTPTGEQQAIIDAYQTGQHLVVEAGAGTGKSSTLRMLAEVTGARRPGLYVAYNASVAKEARGKFPAGVDCRTAHSLAYAAIGFHFEHRLPKRHGQRSGENQAKRLPATEVAKLLGLHGERLGDRYLSGPALARIADATVAQFCRSADLEIGTRHVPAIAGMSAVETHWLVEVILPAARWLWADLCNPQGRLWFTHDAYLKMWHLTSPTLPAEYILFDEAQDADPVIAAVVAAQDHAQLVYVGDRSQAIYGWRGAIDAMSAFAGARLRLSQSFRFGQPIADEANAWLQLLDAELRLTGLNKVTSTVTHATLGERPPRAILCRTNGGSIGAVMDQLEAGRRVALVGEGREIEQFAWAAQSLMAGRGCNLPELAAFKTWRELVQYTEQEESGRDLQVMVKIVQRYGPGALIDTIKRLTPAARAEVTVSTAHKAKGLEWPAVRIGADFAPPGDGDRPDRAELMLAYVAVTRAQNALDVGSLTWRRQGHVDSDGRWFGPDADWSAS